MTSDSVPAPMVNPHFLHVCGGCGLRVSQTNECPGVATCRNIRRDDD